MTKALIALVADPAGFQPVSAPLEALERHEVARDLLTFSAIVFAGGRPAPRTACLTRAVEPTPVSDRSPEVAF